MVRKKSTAESLVKYWPMALFLLSTVGAFYTLKADASQTKVDVKRIETELTSKVEKVDSKADENSKQSQDIMVNQAKQSAVLENIYEAVKEIKAKK